MHDVESLFKRQALQRNPALQTALFRDKRRKQSDLDELQTIPSPSDAMRSIERLVEGTDLRESLETLCIFTNDHDFVLGEPIPSSLFTSFIELLRNFSLNVDISLLVLEFIGNLWRFYDSDFPLLTDPELVDSVWQLSLQSTNSDISNCAFFAVICLADSDLEATREIYSDTSLSDLFTVLAADPSCEFMLNSLRYLEILSESPEGNPLSPFSSFFFHCLCESHCDEIEFLAAEILAHLAIIHRSLPPPEFLAAIVEYLRASSNFEAVMASYAIIRASEFYSLTADFSGLLIRDIARSAERPALGLYHYLELFMTHFPGFCYEQGIVGAILEAAGEMCSDNKQFAALSLVSYMAVPELEHQVRVSLLEIGVIEFLCDVVPVFDVQTAILIVNCIPMILMGDDAGYAAAILESELMQSLEILAEEPGAEDFAEAVAGLGTLLMDNALANDSGN
jgi:hypothetical protein